MTCELRRAMTRRRRICPGKMPDTLCRH